MAELRPLRIPAGSGAYAVRFGPLAGAPRMMRRAGLDPGPALVVTDTTVAGLYLRGLTGALREDGWWPETFAVEPGEGSKSVGTYRALVDWALAQGITRETPVVALGGGVVGDLAGFAAATLLRGLPLVHLPTTVVAQVDSALGGKTGVNHARGKNLIGAFHAPRLVLADWRALRTLAAEEVRAGCAEVVKHGLVADAALARHLQLSLGALLALDPEATPQVLRDAAAVKARVVAADEREAGQRALLNFGHTFGHAIERVAGYGRVLHGEAVAVGMRAALHLSASLRAGRPAPPEAPLPEPFAEADALVRALGVPTRLDGMDPAALTDAMRTDKKRAASGLRFVVLRGVGEGFVASGVPPEMTAAAWDYAMRVGGAG